MYGRRGGGAAERRVDARVDIIEGTLGKAFGCLGGLHRSERQSLRRRTLLCAGFIFTTALPPAICAAACASIRHLKKSQC